MPVNYIHSYVEAAKLLTHDRAFLEKVDTIVAIARAVGALAINRTSLNNQTHRKLCGPLVLCAETGEDMLLPTRCRIQLHSQGLTTTAPVFLDLCVRHGLLKSQCPAQTAAGKLIVSDLVKSYLTATEAPLAA